MVCTAYDYVYCSMCHLRKRKCFRCFLKTRVTQVVATLSKRTTRIEQGIYEKRKYKATLLLVFDRALIHHVKYDTGLDTDFSA